MRLRIGMGKKLSLIRMFLRFESVIFLFHHSALVKATLILMLNLTGRATS